MMLNIFDIVKEEFGKNDEITRADLDKSVNDVVQLLKENRLTVATGESLSGGLLSERRTSGAGASED